MVGGGDGLQELGHGMPNVEAAAKHHLPTFSCSDQSQLQSKVPKLHRMKSEGCVTQLDSQGCGPVFASRIGAIPSRRWAVAALMALLRLVQPVGHRLDRLTSLASSWHVMQA